jgi:hypothetical protein
MKRAFEVDVLVRECGARRAVISCITDRTVARRILGHLGLPARATGIDAAASSADPGLRDESDGLRSIETDGSRAVGWGRSVSRAAVRGVRGLDGLVGHPAGEMRKPGGGP